MQWFVTNLLLRSRPAPSLSCHCSNSSKDWRDTRGGYKPGGIGAIRCSLLFVFLVSIGKYKGEVPDIGFQADIFCQAPGSYRLRTASSNIPCHLRLFDMNRLQSYPTFEEAERNGLANATERL